MRIVPFDNKLKTQLAGRVLLEVFLSNCFERFVVVVTSLHGTLGRHDKCDLVVRVSHSGCFVIARY